MNARFFTSTILVYVYEQTLKPGI